MTFSQDVKSKTLGSPKKRILLRKSPTFGTPRKNQRTPDHIKIDSWDKLDPVPIKVEKDSESKQKEDGM